MATTEHFYTGNNSTTDYSFTFPYLTTTDIKVELDNVATTEYTLPTSTTVRFNTAPGTGVSIHIYRDTDVDTAKAIYAAGSSVRAVDLNNNKDQDLYTLQELKGQTVKTSDIKDGAVTSAKIFDGTIVNADVNASAAIAKSKLASLDIVDADVNASAAIAKSKLASLNIVNADVNASAAIAKSKLAPLDIVNADVNASAAIAKSKLESLNIVDADLNASAAITYSKLEDVNSSKILVGNGSNKAAPVDMSGDVTITNAGVTSIGADAVQIGNISDTETTLTANSDAKIPTSKAVADHITSILNAVGGFVVVADKDSFPTSNPDASDDAGTILSITNPNGLTVSGGTSSNGTRAGVSDTVTITGIPTDAGSTLTANYTMLVQTTSTAHTYTFYKFLAKDGDVLSLSNDINDFAARYRVASSAPGSDNDEGDLYFDTSANKMYVYDGSAWGQVTSTGEFKDLTVVDQGQTSGSPTFNGSNVSFDLRDGSSAASITNRNQLLVVLNGVVQKSNAGTWSSSEEGFYLEGTDGIKFCTAPPSGSTIFVTLIGSATDIPTPGDETVTEAKLNANAPTNDHVLTADSSAGGGFKWAATSAPEGTAVKSTGESGGTKFLREDGDGTSSWQTVNTTPEGTAILSTGESGGSKYLREDGDGTCSWQSVPAGVGGATGADFNDDVKLRFGTGNDMEIYTASNNSGQLRSSSGIGLTTTGAATQATLNAYNTGSSSSQVVVTADSGANTKATLRYNTNEKLSTTNTGISVTGGVTTTGDITTGDDLIATKINGCQRIVLEQFFTPCDGSTIATANGDITVGNVTSAQDLTTSYVDVTGSSISYTPPTGTKQVIYEFYSMHGSNTSTTWNIPHFRLYLDSDEVVYQRKTVTANNYSEMQWFYKYAFPIGGTADTNTGRVASWTSAKTIKIQAREYSAGYQAKLHYFDHWDGGSGTVFVQPTIGITAIG